MKPNFLQQLSLHSILQPPLSFVVGFFLPHSLIYFSVRLVAAYQPWKFTDIKLATGGLWYCPLHARETYWELKEKLLMKTEWEGYKVQTKSVPYLSRSGRIQNFMKFTHKMVYYVLLLQPKGHWDILIQQKIYWLITIINLLNHLTRR